MSIWKANTRLQAKAKCGRCGLQFTPKKEGDKYGPTCARKLAGQVQLDSMALVSGKVLRKRPHPDEECEGYGCSHPSHEVIL
jgi:hypothetical protein